MFLRRISASRGVLGVDIGSRCIRLLQLRGQEGYLGVIGAACVRTTDDLTESGLAEKLKSAVMRGGFTGRRCIVSLPRGDVHVQSVRLPQMPEVELRQAVVWEASQRFGLERGEMEVDFLRTGASSHGTEAREEVLLIAASHEALFARLDPLQKAGLRPIAVDTDFGAIAHLHGRRYRRESDRSQVQAVLELGAAGSVIVILRGDQVAFAKLIDISGEQLDQAVAQHLELDLDSAAELRSSRIARAAAGAQRATEGSGGVEGESSVLDPATDRVVFEAVRPQLRELVKEIVLCLRYFGVTFRGHPPKRILLSGGEGYEPQLDKMISEACKLPVSHDDDHGTLARLAPRIRRLVPATPGPPASWAVAAGLSVRSLGARWQQNIERTTARGAA